MKHATLIQRAIERVAETTGRNFEFCPAYAEPGYSTDTGIFFGNWNPKCGFSVSKDAQKQDPVSRLASVLERAGFNLEWEDEWTTCSDCGKAIRTQPDCYSWTSHFRFVDEYDTVCLDCLKPEEYLASIEDNPRQACPPDIDPTAFGYVKHNGQFETGFHPGQNDDPKAILKAMHAAGMSHVVFRIASKGQFDLTWEAYYKAA